MFLKINLVFLNYNSMIDENYVLLYFTKFMSLDYDRSFVTHLITA